MPSAITFIDVFLIFDSRVSMPFRSSEPTTASMSFADSNICI